MERVILPSYAKINLGLLLLRKREDGYHDIATIFQQIDLYDTLTFRKVPGTIRIAGDHSRLPVDESNLCHRAFDSFRGQLGIKEGLEIHIQKRIPMGSGLGGGSSNAAVTLLAANQLWGGRLSRTDLEEMAAEIGSDVPFFLLGGTALGRGRGEKLTRLDWDPDWWVLLVCSGIHVSTSWAYGQARIALTKVKKFSNFESILSKNSFHALKAYLSNDLEGVVFRRHPILREIKHELCERGAFYASMSGSGSAVYGLFEHRGHAEEAKTFFSIQLKMTTFLCRPMASIPSGEVRRPPRP